MHRICRLWHKRLEHRWLPLSSLYPGTFMPPRPAGANADRTVLLKPLIARNSVFTYKGRSVNIQDVGRELGVRYVLEGSIQTSGDRVRVTAQLIEAATNVHVWSERYDRSLDDIFNVQNEVTQKI